VGSFVRRIRGYDRDIELYFVYTLTANIAIGAVHKRAARLTAGRRSSWSSDLCLAIPTGYQLKPLGVGVLQFPMSFHILKKQALARAV
jgi:hypothetical protein